MLKRLYIDNYKCFSNFEFVPGPLTLLMGRNGSGKTALFEVLELVRDFALGRCDAQKFSDRTRTRWDSRTNQTFELEAALPLVGHYKYRLIIDHFDSANSWVLKEELDLDGVRVLTFKDQEVSVLRDDDQTVTFPADWRRSAIGSLPPLPGRLPGTLASAKTHLRPTGFRDWLSTLHAVSPDPRRITGRASETGGLGLDLIRDMSNFPLWYRRVFGQQMERQREFDDDLRSLIDNFSSITLEPTGRASYDLGVKLKASKVTADNYALSLDELSDGQRVLIALYALLRFLPGERGEGGQTLWIDEPDNFVSLAEIQPWLIALRERVEIGDGFQALVTSHHPEVINYLAADCGQVLDREGGGPVRVRPFSLDPASGLSPAELVARDRA